MISHTAMSVRRRLIGRQTPSRYDALKKAMAELDDVLVEMRTELREKQTAIDVRPRNSVLVLQAMIERVKQSFHDFNRQASRLGYAPQGHYVYGSSRRRANRSMGNKISRLLVETKKLLAASSLRDRG